MILAIKIVISFLVAAISSAFAFFSSAISLVDDSAYQGSQVGVGTQINEEGEMLSFAVALVTFVIIFSVGIYLSKRTTKKTN